MAQTPTTPVKVMPAGGLPKGNITDVSISVSLPVSQIRRLEEREVEQLTQERLEQLWKELTETCKDDEKLHDLLKDKVVVLKNNNLFDIQVPNLYFDTLLRKYQTRILGWLRERTANESLQYRAVVVVEKVAAKAYLPRDKFDELAKVNPAMYALRKIFPDIDF